MYEPCGAVLVGRRRARPARVACTPCPPVRGRPPVPCPGAAPCPSVRGGGPVSPRRAVGRPHPAGGSGRINCGLASLVLLIPPSVAPWSRRPPIPDLLPQPPRIPVRQLPGSRVAPGFPPTRLLPDLSFAPTRLLRPVFCGHMNQPMNQPMNQ